jgi:hypothetical protein
MKQINKKCFIYETLSLVFPSLMFLLKNIKSKNDLFNIVAISKDEKDLEISVLNFDLEKSIYRINIFLTQNNLKHPSFILDLNLNDKKAKILSFESQIKPNIRIDCYTEVDGVVYINKLAEKDLEILCLDWMKQIKHHLYEQIIDKNIKTA